MKLKIYSKSLTLFTASLFAFLGGTSFADPEGIENPPPLVRWAQEDGITMQWFGLRPTLQDAGAEIYGSYTAEVWGNTTGGLSTGTVYTGLLDFGLELDLEKLAGWKGATLNTTWLWSSGKDASQELVGNFFTISNIAALPTVRMLELWLEQKAWDDKVSIRLGQITADSDFVVSDYSGLFINGTFGWPAFLYMNLPAGGPGFPMGTLGIRGSVSPVEWFTFQSAVFQGNVYDQDINRRGFRWALNGQNGFLFMNEAQSRWNHAEEETGLPGQAKLGFWAQSGNLANTLASSTTSGNYGVYAVLDQMLFRESSVTPAPEKNEGKNPVAQAGKKTVTPSTPEHSDQGLGFFGRLAYQNGDRNFINFYFDTGFSYKGLIPGRDKDTIGLGFAYAQIGSTASDAMTAGGASGVGAEMVLEATYQMQVTKWMTLQPDRQYVINPGGASDLSNALVLGIRANIAF